MTLPDLQQHTTYIPENDAPSVSCISVSRRVSESIGTATVTVQLSTPYDEPIDACFTESAGTASANDFSLSPRARCTSNQASQVEAVMEVDIVDDHNPE